MRNTAPKAARTAITLVVNLAIMLGAANAASAAPSGSNHSSSAFIAGALGRAAAHADLTTAAPSTTTSGSAALTGHVDIPLLASKGVKLSDNGQAVMIGLPGAGSSGAGQKIADGAVVYSSSIPSANAVIPGASGAQFLITIKDRQASTSYAYRIQLPSGVFVHIQPDGSALVLAKDGSFGLKIGKPWAHDATGRSVPTHYIVDGTSLVQVINHRQRGVVYPVVADPSFHWWWGGVDIYFTRAETAWVVGVGLTAISALLPVRYIVAIGLGQLQPEFQNAWRQNKCVVLHDSWVRPSYTGLYNC